MNDDPTRTMREANRRAWDAVVEPHLGSPLYSLEAFKRGESSLRSIELEALGDVSGKSLLHLQCHFGKETLSWARLGAEATGVDISEQAIAAARHLGDEIGVPARFIVSDLYDLPGHLDGQFDIVFTSYGVINWLPDLQRWASVVHHFVAPGGVFYIAEIHPALQMLDLEQGGAPFAYDYFNSPEPIVWDGAPDYAGAEVAHEGKHYEWQHSLAEIISPLLAEGLVLEEFREFPWSPSPGLFPNLEQIAEGRWRVREPRVEVPHVFSAKFRRSS